MYLQSFSYLLSGEFAIYSDLATHLRIPSDWGLEVGIWQNFSETRLMAYLRSRSWFVRPQAQEVITNGLLSTAEESLITLLRTLTETDGIEVQPLSSKVFKLCIKRLAQDKIANIMQTHL